MTETSSPSGAIRRSREWPASASILEINTWVWLAELSSKYRRAITLLDVPAAEWDALRACSFDSVWLMGVWERSPAGIEIANQNDGLRAEFEHVLPDFHPRDNVGSAYCIRRYVVDPHLGGADGLATARRQLSARGMRLILDFVPNHVAADHHWVETHTDYFMLGTHDDAIRDPASFLEVNDTVYARGRDPYFPAWPDVLQLDAFSPALRQAAIATLSGIADQCDGVRCDMAMLFLNQIFARTWHQSSQPPTEYWTDVISVIRTAHPGFVFIAEAYWHTEWQLHELGFDFCYDKVLYDRLLGDDADAIRQHLAADIAWQRTLVRFTENHDEPRAAAVFPPGKNEAAAVVIATLPGLRFFHQGQMEGRRVRLPVFLGRAPEEAADERLATFYRKLLGAINTPALRDGQWQSCSLAGWPENTSFENLLAWCWSFDGVLCLIVVNWSAAPAQARVYAPWPAASTSLRLEDRMSGAIYERNAGELQASGLFVDLGAWGFHFLVCAHS